MIKKSFLPLVALLVLSCITQVNGQAFNGDFNPVADLNLSRGQGPLNAVIFDLSNDFGVAANSVLIRVDNAFVASDVNSDAFTVSDQVETTFTSIGSRDVTAFVNHGRNLGSALFTNGTGTPRDGVRAANGETWTFTTDNNPANFDTSRYTVGTSGNDFFVDYTAVNDPNTAQFNPIGFRWTSDQPVTSFSVFTTNTQDLDNNFTVGFEIVPVAVPEPTSAVIVAFSGLLLLRRKRS